MGLNERGLIVAMTNRRKTHLPAHIRSRGLLCRDLLGCPSTEAALERLDHQLTQHDFAGFNVLILSSKSAVVVEMGDMPRRVHLQRGIHIIGNQSLNDPTDGRVVRARRETQARLTEPRDSAAVVAAAQAILALPGTEGEPALCIVGGDWGTVSSTIIALDERPASVRYLYAPGPPDRTVYDDYSSQARELLSAVASGGR